MARKRWLRWHKWLALSFGWLFLLQGFTGALLAVQAEIDGALNPELLQAGQLSGAISFGEVYATVQQAYPGKRVIFIQTPSHGLGVYEVVLDKITGLRVYVDGVTGDITGERGAFTILKNILLILHTGILGGAWLEGVYGLSGFAALIMLLCGLVVWWPRRWSRAFKVSTNSLWGFVISSHTAVGGALFLVLLPVVVTGIMLSFHHSVEDLAYALTGEAPAVHKPDISPQALRSYSASELDRIIAEAREATSGASASFIVLPRRENDMISVRLRHTGVWHPTGRSQAWFHPTNLSLITSSDERLVSATERFLNTLYPVHIGQWAGLDLRWLWSLMGTLVLLLGLGGVSIWLKRRRLRA